MGPRGRYTSVDNDHFILIRDSCIQLRCEAIGNAITGSTVRQLQERHQERLADAQAKLKECLLEGVLTEDRVEPRRLRFISFRFERFVPRKLPWALDVHRHLCNRPVITIHQTLCVRFYFRFVLSCAVNFKDFGKPCTQ